MRVVAGLVLLVAAALLWPFSGWSWWPVLGGLGVLVLLYLLRLDRLLFGWAPHLAGLVTVVLMAARSDPWAWGLAGGIAVLGVGLARLPDRRVLAAGVALVVVFGVGYGVSHFRTAEEQRAEQARGGAERAANVMALPAELIAGSLANSIAAGDDATACALLGVPARDQFAASVGAPDCASAVRMLAAQVTDPTAYRNVRLPSGAVVKQSATPSLDACRATFPPSVSAPGPRLGRFELRRFDADRYLIAAYAPCR